MKTKTKKKPVKKVTALAKVTVPEMGIQESVFVMGNLAVLSEEQRADYYLKVCKSLGLNPFTKPFGYITLNGKMCLYALKDCTEQLRKIHGVSITNLDGKIVDDLYVVTATGKDKNGKVDCATGAVQIKNTFGDAKANAIMKAETKAKRRLTLSMCGLGMLDEAETETIPGAQIQESNISVESHFGEPAKAQEEKKQKPAAEKPMDQIIKALPEDIKNLLKEAGYDTLFKAYDAYKKVEGDLDALKQLCEEKIRRGK